MTDDCDSLDNAEYLQEYSENISNNYVDEEITKPPPKKLRGKGKVWVKETEFEAEELALEFIKNEVSLFDILNLFFLPVYGWFSIHGLYLFGLL